MCFILNKSGYKKGKNILEYMIYYIFGMIFFFYFYVLLVRFVIIVVEEVIVMVVGQVVVEFVVIVVEDYDVMVIGFNVVMVIGFYCCYGCCVCCGVFSFEFFVDNKYCYDMVFNVVLKFVDFVLYCNLK